jgi:hypothetical protein
MSNPRGRADGMKIKKSLVHPRKSQRNIGFFGKARFIRKFDGKHEPIGGTAENHSTVPANGVRFSHLMSYSAIRRGTSSFCRLKTNNRQQRFPRKPFLRRWAAKKAAEKK